MNRKRVLSIMGAVFLVICLSIQPARGATLTWHSSIKAGTSWTWKVTEYSGVPETIFPVFENLSQGSVILVNATGNPPTVGDWGTMIAGIISWADLVIDGSITTIGANVIYFLVAPLDIGNASYGWDAWLFLISLATAFVGPNYHSSNTTTANSITYHVNNTGTNTAVSHDITYDNSTGLLKKYEYGFSNTSLSSSMTITRSTGGGLFDFLSPGYEIALVLIVLPVLAALPVFRRKK